MKTENLSIKAITKATTYSENAIEGIIDSGHTKMNGIDLSELAEAIRWAIDERTNDILGDLRSTPKQMWDDNYDKYRCQGFDDAVNLINDNYFE